jgi:hypothetical protein
MDLKMGLFNIPRLEQYCALGYNVLLSGHAGIGKTVVITQVFQGMKWMYFSASTMDPWVDLVGVPRPIPDEKRGGYVLELVRPEFVKADDVEAIFIDELNRAPDKVLNALMELIQFRSINGLKLKNLRVIWAAINPDDDGEYAVNKLDRALKDRFQVQINIPFKLDEQYFHNKYPEVASAFCSWWNDLPTDIKKEVSPRRLEYAIQAHLNKCHLADFLPENSNISKLRQSIKSLSFAEILTSISNEEEAKAFLNSINNSTRLLQMASAKNEDAMKFFNTYKSVMPQELIEALMPSVQAAELNLPMVTFPQLLTQINTSKKSPGTKEFTDIINGVVLLEDTKTLSEIIKGYCTSSTSVGFSRLCQHINKVLATGSQSVLQNACKKPDGKPSNLVTVTMQIATQDTTYMFFTKEQRKKINAHTYAQGIAASKWM